MNLKYYKVGNRVIATMGKIDGTEITEEEFISEMQRVCANMEANAEGLRCTKQVVNMLADQTFTDSTPYY